MSLSKIILNKVLWAQQGDLFCRRFALANKAYLGWPISLDWSQEEHHYIVSDKDFRIHVARTARISRYKKGIRERLEKIYSSYLLHHVPISEDDTVIDCGANIGEVGLYLANRFGCRVLSIEPEEREVRCLHKNLRGLKHTIDHAALWKTSGEMDLFEKNDTGDSSLFQTENFASRKRIITRTLDELVKNSGEEKIKLLKLEAEGAEPEILQGAGRTLPLIEYIAADLGPERGASQEKTAPEVINYLCKNGFDLVDISQKRLVCLFKNRST
ncbi:FkbM family methyltransferase [Methylonatrum kenyense]|uniref:FkbM family methyltransferase n=1 Tax=Methylonatrum kenyense TaxID=455253 RepID=UPI0020BFF1C1|nr:FkbM family methyltransferase [Methylonatrum kenyense]MCK8516996.1 FkbM family methyltransferase [Methylonatrum kenyense]